MFQHAYRLPFRLLGIPVQLDLTFLIVLPLFAWVIGSNIPAYVELFDLELSNESLADGATAFWIGLAAAVGLFASVLVHELGHCVVGRRYDLEIENITLWLLGGLARFKEMPKHGGIEAVVAIAGPLTSFALAGVCWLVFVATSAESPALHFVCAYLMWMNVVLGTFNLLPALPLDGGRVLRSLLELRMGHVQATLAAANASRMMALGLGLVGFLSGHIFLMLVALFVFMAGTAELQSATAAEALRGIRVRDLMSRGVHTVDPSLRVTELFDRMLADGYLAYPVVGIEGRVDGWITLQAIRERIRSGGAENERLLVRDLMSREVDSVRPSESALEAFQRIGQNGSGRLVVVDRLGRLRGVISKTDLVRAVEVRLVGQLLSEARRGVPPSGDGAASRDERVPEASKAIDAEEALH